MQQYSRTSEIFFANGPASASSQDMDIELPSVPRNMNKFEALVKTLRLGHKDSRPLQKDALDEPFVLKAICPPPGLKRAQPEADAVEGNYTMYNAPLSDNPFTITPSNESNETQSNETNSRLQQYLKFDPDDDSDWEMELDSTTAEGYESDADSDGVIDENGVGIIWHAERLDSSTDMVNNNRGEESDFLHVDVFSAEMYFRAMSLRAAPACHRS